MATQAIELVPETADGAAAATPPKGKGGMVMAIVGAIAGIAIGFFVSGPMIAKNRVASPPKHVEEAPSTSVAHPIENLVLNPAGSGGTRFLMVTATFELKDAAADVIMKEHEAEVRDHILALLGRKSVDDLTDITLRDGIKTEVLDAVRPLLPKGSVLKVFFPQFVIQ